MSKQQAGFTLIELVVVIVVLGILAAVAIPKYVDLAQKAREAVQEGTKGALAGGAALYIADNAGVKPTTAQVISSIEQDGVAVVGTACVFTITATSSTNPLSYSMVSANLCQ